MRRTNSESTKLRVCRPFAGPGFFLRLLSLPFRAICAVFMDRRDFLHRRDFWDRRDFLHRRDFWDRRDFLHRRDFWDRRDFFSKPRQIARVTKKPKNPCGICDLHYIHYTGTWSMAHGQWHKYNLSMTIF